MGDGGAGVAGVLTGLPEVWVTDRMRFSRNEVWTIVSISPCCLDTNVEALSQSLSVVFAAHPALQGLAAVAVSALWYFSGFQDIRRGRIGVGALWIFIAFAILLATAIGFVVFREFAAAAIAFAGLLGGVAITVKYRVLAQRKSADRQRGS